MVVDFIVLVPFMGIGLWSLSASREVALFTSVPLVLFFAFYNIYFIGRWGQTIGKMAMNIKVVSLDGTQAGFTRAFYRHSVDLGFSVISAVVMLSALISISSEYNTLSFEAKMLIMAEELPAWAGVVDVLDNLWIASELVVLLLNEKRRALHDFIAGTVVIHT